MYYKKNLVNLSNKLLGGENLPPNIHDLGSLRYSKQWITYRYKRLNSMNYKNLPQHPKEFIEVLFILSQPSANTNWDAVERVIRMFTIFKNIRLTIKPHTRNWSTKIKITSENIIVDSDTDTSFLIKQCDYTLFSSSSIALEAYSIGKHCFVADFLNYNQILYTKYNAGSILFCLDHLYEALIDLEEGNPIEYNKENVDNMLKDLVYNGCKDEPVDNYVKLIESL